MADVEFPLRIEIPNRVLENERGRAFIDPHAFEIGDVDVAYGNRGIDLVVQLLDPVVDVGRQIGVRPARKILAFDFEQRCAHLDLDGAAEVLADDLDRIFHRDMRIQNFNQR